MKPLSIVLSFFLFSVSTQAGGIFDMDLTCTPDEPSSAKIQRVDLSVLKLQPGQAMKTEGHMADVFYTIVASLQGKTVICKSGSNALRRLEYQAMIDSNLPGAVSISAVCPGLGLPEDKLKGTLFLRPLRTSAVFHDFVEGAYPSLTCKSKSADEKAKDAASAL